MSQLLKFHWSFQAISFTILLIAVSCNPPQATESTETFEENVIVENVDTLLVDIKSSVLTWVTESPNGKINGIIPINSGLLFMSNNDWRAGSISFNMQKISVKNPPKKGISTTSVLDDLQSAHFFWTDTFPSAKIDFLGFKEADSTNSGLKETRLIDVPTHWISMGITLKGIYQTIDIPVSIEKTSNTTRITGNFTVRRADWGLNYPDEKAAGDNQKKDSLFHNINFGLYLSIPTN